MRCKLSSAKPAHLPSSVGGKGISLLVSHEFSYQRLFLSCWALVFEVSHSDRSEGDSGHVPSSGNSCLFPIRAAPMLNATHSDAWGSLEFLIRQIRVHRENTSPGKKAQGDMVRRWERKAPTFCSNPGSSNQSTTTRPFSDKMFAGYHKNISVCWEKNNPELSAPYHNEPSSLWLKDAPEGCFNQLTNDVFTIIMETM